MIASNLFRQLNMNTNNSDQKNDWLQIVRQHVETVGHGSVAIAVDDSKIVHLDTTKKWRLPASQEPRKLERRR